MEADPAPAAPPPPGLVGAQSPAPPGGESSPSSRRARCSQPPPPLARASLRLTHFHPTPPHRRRSTGLARRRGRRDGRGVRQLLLAHLLQHDRHGREPPHLARLQRRPRRAVPARVRRRARAVPLLPGAAVCSFSDAQAARDGALGWVVVCGGCLGVFGGCLGGFGCVIGCGWVGGCLWVLVCGLRSARRSVLNPEN